MIVRKRSGDFEGDHADVVIVGAGPSGGVAAAHLAERGYSVVCLEQGEWPDRSEYPGATPEWELAAAKQWSSRPSVRQSPADYPVDVADSDYEILNFNGVGGASVLYAAVWPRLLPDDFRVRSIDGVADDWPLGYDDLVPYYEQTDRDFGVSGLGGNPAYPSLVEPPLPPLPIGRAGLLVARAHARLGWHWWPAYNAILSAPYMGRNVCVQRGSCTSGCNEGAKASSDITHWPRALAHGAHLETGARVQRVVLDRRGLARGVEWIDAEGGQHLQTADVVVLAANGIGTPRILLNSASASHPDGLGNGSGLVGRNLMLHPLVQVSGLFDEQLEGWHAHAGRLVESLEFARSDPSRGFLRGAKWALGTAGGPMRAAYAPDGLGVWGGEHHRHVRERLGRSATWVLVCEDLPQETNRVELSDTITDAFGIPAPKISYRLDDNTRRLIDWQLQRASESLLEAGAYLVEENRDLANGHLMGTARMGRDPRSSVVDPWCVMHEVPNLLVVDGSVFVTCGTANPTSTIAALALRAVTHYVARRHEVPVPDQSHVVAVTYQAPAVAAPTVSVPLPTRPFDEDERARFGLLADAVIPPGDGMPAPSAIGVHTTLLDRLLAVRPDLTDPLRRALAEVELTGPSDAPAALAHMETADPDCLRALRYAVAGAYYLSPEVRAELGYPGTVPRPVSARTFPEYLEEDLLEHMLDPA